MQDPVLSLFNHYGKVFVAIAPRPMLVWRLDSSPYPFFCHLTLIEHITNMDTQLVFFQAASMLSRPDLAAM